MRITEVGWTVEHTADDILGAIRRLNQQRSVVARKKTLWVALLLMVVLTIAYLAMAAIVLFW
jgi:hypothetical protein